MSVNCSGGSAGHSIECLLLSGQQVMDLCAKYMIKPVVEVAPTTATSRIIGACLTQPRL